MKSTLQSGTKMKCNYNENNIRYINLSQSKCNYNV